MEKKKTGEETSAISFSWRNELYVCSEGFTRVSWQLIYIYIYEYIYVYVAVYSWGPHGYSIRAK